MATEQQCKMLMARSIEAGMPYKYKEFVDLTNGQVTEKVKEIEAFAPKDAKETAAKPAAVSDNFNVIRFGLACKLIVQESNVNFLLDNEQMFIQKAKDLNNLFSKAEAAVSAASSSHWLAPLCAPILAEDPDLTKTATKPDDQDYRAEMAMKRQFEDDGNLQQFPEKFNPGDKTLG